MKAIALVLLLGLSLPALCDEGPSLTPPAEMRPSVPPQPAILSATPIPATLAADQRLERPVTLRCRRQPLAEVLKLLQKETGVTMSAARDVAEEPAVVFISAKPAREVMARLSGLFKYQWARRFGKAGYSYELFQDQASKREEEALRETEEQGAWSDLFRNIRHLQALAGRSPDALLASWEADMAKQRRYWERYLGASAADRQRMTKTESPQWVTFDQNWLGFYSLSQPMGRAQLALLGQISPAGWQVLREEGVLFFSPTPKEGTLPMPPRIARQLADAVPATPPNLLRREPDYHRTRLEGAVERWRTTKDRRVTVRVRRYDYGAELKLHLVVAPVGLAGGPPGDDFSGIGDLQVYGLYRRTPGEPRNPDQVPAEWKSHPTLGIRKALHLKPPTDPWLTAPAFGQPMLRSPGMLAQVAETYGIDLIADGYRKQREPFETLADGKLELPLYHALNRWALRDSDWNLRGDVLHVRRRTWFHDRLEEIPESMAARWATRFRRDVRLNPEDIAALAGELRDGQLKQLVGVLRERGVFLGEGFEEQMPYAVAVSSARGALLRAYGALLPAQRAQLERGGALQTTALPANARRWLRIHLARLDQQNPGSGPHLESGGILRLSALPIRRTVQRIATNERLGYFVTYSLDPPSTPELEEAWKLYLSDFVPDAPGVQEPPPGDAFGVRLHFAGRHGESSASVLLPWAALRDRAGIPH